VPGVKPVAGAETEWLVVSVAPRDAFDVVFAGEPLAPLLEHQSEELRSQLNV
jgi:hypothetical protein